MLSNVWFKGLLAAIVNGAVDGLFLNWIAPGAFPPKVALMAGVASGLRAGLLYLKNNPVGADGQGFVLKTALALSDSPAIKAWAERKARLSSDTIRKQAALGIDSLHAAAGLPPPIPAPKPTSLIRLNKDILAPGQVAVVDGKAYRVMRLLSSNITETIYEAVEV